MLETDDGQGSSIRFLKKKDKTRKTLGSRAGRTAFLYLTFRICDQQGPQCNQEMQRGQGDNSDLHLEGRRIVDAIVYRFCIRRCDQGSSGNHVPATDGTNRSDCYKNKKTTKQC